MPDRSSTVPRLSSKCARRWLNLGFAFQPSELLKLALPLMLAWYFHRNEAVLRAKHFLIGGALLAVPFLLILRQPDLGFIAKIPDESLDDILQSIRDGAKCAGDAMGFGAPALNSIEQMAVAYYRGKKYGEAATLLSMASTKRWRTPVSWRRGPCVWGPPATSGTCCKSSTPRTTHKLT